MQVEQAIFTSARTRKAQGYQLVARSPGVDDQIARILFQWCPSHAGLFRSELDASSLNFFTVSGDLLCLSRTMYGGPEYSSRGGLQMFTRLLLLSRDQLASYDFNPLAMAREAMALGYLTLELDPPEQLPMIDLPRRCVSDMHAGASHTAWPGLMSTLRRQLGLGGRVAVVGVDDPLVLLNDLFIQTAPPRRLELSFTTGLRPSLHRLFRVHFLPSADTRTRRQLASQGVTVVTV